MRFAPIKVVCIACVLSTALIVSCDEKTSPVSPGNAPPVTPHLPMPADSSEYVREYLEVSWECSDPDGDNVTCTVQVKEDGFTVFSGQTLLKTIDTGLFLLSQAAC